MMTDMRKGNIVLHTIGKLLMIVGGSMLFPLMTAFIYKESCGSAFLVMLPVTLVAGAAMHRIFHPGKRLHMQTRDGAYIVTFGWILAALFGMMPYLLSGTFTDVADAFFVLR